MKIFALLSWFDEDPEHLKRCVSSLEGFADAIVAVDGAYATFPGAKSDSAGQFTHVIGAAREAGLACHVRVPQGPWAGGEVQKRAAMFDFGRQAGATPEDWFLIIDADMALAEGRTEARDRLAATDMAVAEVRWHDVQIDGKPCSTHTFRSLFRALSGLTVERAHFLYVTPDGDPRRFLWHSPDGGISKEPALDLTDAVTLHHFNSQREPERKQRALGYYRDRDAATLESAGDWR